MAQIGTRRGSKVRYAGEEMTVAGTNGFNLVIVRSKSGEYLDAKVEDLVAEAKGSKPKPIAVDIRRNEKVASYTEALGPLMSKGRKTRADVAAAAAKINISTAAAYDALKRYSISGKAADLPPPTRPGGRGKSRLPAKVEQIITDEITRTFLKRPNYNFVTFCENVSDRLAKAGFKVSEATLRNRIAAIPDYQKVKATKGHTEAERLLAPIKGETPEVMRPLEVIQMDHWYCDLLTLSDNRLTVIGRLWLTLAIDVFTRVVWGLHVGLDAPSTITAGLCMISGMTRKEPTLVAMNLSFEMPFYGKPQNLQLDNAGEFTSRSMSASCEHFGISPKFRPVTKPNYGTYIERLNGTLATKFKTLPGATGSNPAQRKELRPEATAAFTLEDATTQIWMMVNEYHNTEHAGLHGKTPLQKWTDHFFGPEGQIRPIPPIPLDTDELRINWYPLEERTLQRYGLRIDFIDYYCEAIELLVRNREDHGPVWVRRHPFNIKVIFLLHPVRKEWITVTSRYLALPEASIHELKTAKREALKQKRKPIPEYLASLIRDRRSHAEVAIKKTRTAARDEARRSHHGRIKKAERAASNDTVSKEITILPTKPRQANDLSRSPKIIRAGTGKPRVSTVDDMAAALAAVTDSDVKECLDD